MLRSPDFPCMVTYCDHDQWLSIQFITGFSSFFPTIIVPISIDSSKGTYAQLDWNADFLYS